MVGPWTLNRSCRNHHVRTSGHELTLTGNGIPGNFKNCASQLPPPPSKISGNSRKQPEINGNTGLFEVAGLSLNAHSHSPADHSSAIVLHPFAFFVFFCG